MNRTSRPILGWALYDFANSAYATSILSVIFSVYLVNVLVPADGVRFFRWMIPGESVWGYLISAVMVCVIVMSPPMGALADVKSAKRAFLLLWTLVGALATMALVLATPGRLGVALVLVFVATLGYELSLVFYNAFLNDIATDENKGRISGLGYGVGYVGGGLCLALNMVMIAKPHWFGWQHDKTLPVRLSFLVVGGWWLLFSLPMFLWVKDKPFSDGKPSQMRPLKQTFLWIWKTKDLKRFLLAFLIYNDGIQTVLLMASIFGAKALGMSVAQLGLCFLMIQFVAFFGAMIFGPLADRWSHKKAVLTTLVIYVMVTIWAVFMKTTLEFWVLGAIVGLILGGSQAASRSLYSRMIPAHKSGELFAFYSVVGKAAALMGPFFFALMSQNFGLRAAVGSLTVFFILGIALLSSVDEKRGHELSRQLK